MQNEEFRAVIKHFYLKKWTAAQIKAEFDTVHHGASTLETINFWINEFKSGRTSTKDGLKVSTSARRSYKSQKMITVLMSIKLLTALLTFLWFSMQSHLQ